MKRHPLEIVYQDEHLVAVHKPPGLAVHRSRLHPGEKRFALQTVRDQIGQRVYPVHRLDKPTSGVLLFALHAQAAHRMAAAFGRQAVHKTYLAVVRGYVEARGRIDHPLHVVDATGLRGAVPKKALTDYRRLATVELSVAVSRYATSRYALVEAQPLTGRMHQIRRHLRHTAHPVIGDKRYGDARHNRFFKHDLQCGRLLLAAVEMAFDHPYSRTEVTITAPLDQPFAALLERLGWHAVLPDRWANAALIPGRRADRTRAGVVCGQRGRKTQAP